ncbi:MAG: hypothetical protein QG599_1664 [Pseudomonadota bacterium]|nr:hypothetical protein [Pseudomonadota bacterium]
MFFKKSCGSQSRLCCLTKQVLFCDAGPLYQNAHDDENLAFVDVETGVHDADTLAGASKNFRFIDTLL